MILPQAVLETESDRSIWAGHLIGIASGALPHRLCTYTRLAHHRASRLIRLPLRASPSLGFVTQLCLHPLQRFGARANMALDLSYF